MGIVKEREKAIKNLIKAGVSNRVIASQMLCCRKTVAKFRQSLLDEQYQESEDGKAERLSELEFNYYGLLIKVQQLEATVNKLKLSNAGKVARNAQLNKSVCNLCGSESFKCGFCGAAKKVVTNV